MASWIHALQDGVDGMTAPTDHDHERHLKSTCREDWTDALQCLHALHPTMAMGITAADLDVSAPARTRREHDPQHGAEDHDVRRGPPDKANGAVGEEGEGAEDDRDNEPQQQTKNPRRRPKRRAATVSRASGPRRDELAEDLRRNVETLAGYCSSGELVKAALERPELRKHVHDVLECMRSATAASGNDDAASVRRGSCGGNGRARGALVRRAAARMTAVTGNAGVSTGDNRDPEKEGCVQPQPAELQPAEPAPVDVVQQHGSPRPASQQNVLEQHHDVNLEGADIEHACKRPRPLPQLKACALQ